MGKKAHQKNYLVCSADSKTPGMVLGFFWFLFGTLVLLGGFHG